MGSIFDDAVRDMEDEWGLVLIYPMDRPYIYVSYQQEQFNQAKIVVKVLFDLGYPIWFDRNALGTVWNGEISDELEGSVLVVRLTDMGVRQRPLNRCEEEFANLLNKRVLQIRVDSSPEEPVTSDREDVLNCDPKDDRFTALLQEKLLKMGFAPDMGKGERPPKPSHDLMLRFFPDANDRIRKSSIENTDICNLRTHQCLNTRLLKKYTLSEKEIEIAQELKLESYFLKDKSPMPDYKLTNEDISFTMAVARGAHAISDKELKAFYDKRRKYRETSGGKDE